MSTPAQDPLLESLVNDFGGNYVFALDLLEQYRKDPSAVEPGWRTYFDTLSGRASEPAPQPGSDAGGTPRPSAELQAVPRSPLVPAERSRALARVPILPGDVLQPIRGGAVRAVENMEASLSVPTATSARTIPVRTLEENRRLLNKHRDSTGQPRVSFTHVIAWAILRALDAFPRMNDAYAEVDGQPHRVHRDEVRLGIAVDVQRKDGSRSLLVPNVRNANRLGFAELLKAFEDVVSRTRKGSVSPDEFMGTTVSLTNPGTVGTTSSAPRLMPGQGVIVATGALDYPAEYRSMAPRTLGLLGISKVMTLTSTYDHRIVQGAESGLFLGRIEELLKGEDGFYDRIFSDLGVPFRPVRWEMDVHPAVFGTPGGREEVEKQTKVLQLIHNYRVRGHLVADLDPLEASRAPHRDLDPATYGLTLWDLDREFLTGGLSGRDRATLREILDVLRETYCGTLAVEYMYIADPERKEWLQHRMESTRNYPALDAASKRRVLEKLVEAESFERFLHAKYVGHKRFSLEGGEALIPLLDRVLNDAAVRGLREVVLGMPHRGRLNVLANTVGKPISAIFAEFEGNDPSSYQGSGDVKYHVGARGTHVADTGETIAVTLAPNPSHLEWVNPVVEGMTRAKQDAMGDRDHARVLPLLMHGDAAFAGQGVVAETMHLSGLHGYRTGGTIHVVVNNQIGFTTLPEDARSSTYATDVAKMVHAPAFHVNGDDPEAVSHVAGLALEYRQKFRKDVVIDLVCYRRFGHNETDEPSYTQPLMYAKIKTHPSAASLYGAKLVREGVVTREELDKLWAEKKAEMSSEGVAPAAPFEAVERRQPRALAEVDPAAMRARLRTVLKALGTLPEGFEIHPKLLPFVRRRAELAEGRGEVDWATAESLAWGTLLLEGVPVRLSGQDSGRGTFSQRHAVLHDVRTQQEHVPLNAVAPAGAVFEVYDSLLSEAAVMGFEFGYSVAEPRALVMWEAQFGDFANGAQVIVDQFLAGSETKWGQPSSLVLLLPHGQEGQGPEHSSARIERFLQLAACDNLRIAYPSTPASCFHLLRLHAREPQQKPLVVFTPKSLLRHPRCVSSLEDLAQGGFAPVLDDHPDPARVRRVVLCTGKVYYDLLKAREDERRQEVALVRLERLYPLPARELEAVLAAYAPSAELVWCQEEPRNMGAWSFLRERFLDGAVRAGGRVPRYAGRPASAATAPGRMKVHLQEQEALVRDALRLSEDPALSGASAGPERGEAQG
ncbi:MAG TPA: multifunctional oxoglutarate decarboxylase/oxoglutarate dehydrogenase thiamine pyrophosphate-binding subunit/dihydrolipoyllysine-residue succinyltransferase subunit [Vicinamibacteria bacterium]|nr:multifunctional oxoglutarate decarboxylase/oxoglutarate dehydrogenase thiamine pyrophosphate-binding subunit/dihydrolipoyllysine-residue succinyltransferase subunit [Vicinamibacteria bacterium]